MKKLTNQQNKPFKLLILLASIIMMLLLFVGTALTFAYKSLLKKQAKLNSQNSQIEQTIDDYEKDNEFLNEKEGEVIIKH